jgi:hypothetical protein
MAIRPFTPTLNPSGAQRREIAERVNALLRGKVNSTGSVTLASGGATTTTLTDINIGPESVIFMSARTANAAGFLSGLYVSAKMIGSATLTHAANTAGDRIYDYAVFG